MRAVLKSLCLFFIIFAGFLIVNAHNVAARTPSADDITASNEVCDATFPGNANKIKYCHSCFEVAWRAGEKDTNTKAIAQQQDLVDIYGSCSTSFNDGNTINKCSDCAASDNVVILDKLTQSAKGELKPASQQQQPGTTNPQDVKIRYPDPNKTPLHADVQKQIADRCATQVNADKTLNYDTCLYCSAIAATYGIGIDGTTGGLFQDKPACQPVQGGGDNYTYCIDNCVRKQNAGQPDGALGGIVDQAQKDAAQDAEDAAKGAGVKTSVVDIPGINCGVPDSAYNRCCRPSKIAFKLSLDQGVSASGAAVPEKKSGWGWNPIRWVGKVTSAVITGAAKDVLNYFGGLIFNKANDLSSKITRNVVKDADLMCALPPPEYLHTSDDPNDPTCKCVLPDETTLGVSKNSSSLCNSLEGPEKDQCNACNGAVQSQVAGVWTAIGCVPSDVGGFVEKKVFPFGLGLAGVSALLVIFYSAFLIQTSQGNPERLKKARQYLNSALIGLGMVIFAIFILQLIGVKILNLPGLSDKGDAPARDTNCPAGKLPVPGGGCQ